MKNKSFSLTQSIAYGFIPRFWCIALLFSLLAGSVISQPAFSSSTHAGELSLNLFRESVNKVKDCDSVDNVPKAKVQANYGKLPLYFIQNNGQMDEKVKFYEIGNGRSMFFTGKGIYLSFIGNKQSSVSGLDSEVKVQETGVRDQGARWHGLRCERSVERQTCLSVPSTIRDEKELEMVVAENKQTGTSNTQIQSSKLHNPHSAIKNSTIQNLQSELFNPTSEVIKFMPIGANKTVKIIAEGLQEGKVNYFIGNDANKWKTNISTYRTVVYKDIYKDIDMRFYGNNRQMEYDIIVKPGANPSRVRFAYRGIKDLRVTDEGDLEIYLKGGKLIQKKPCIYQKIDGKKVDVGGEFQVSSFKFQVENSKPEIHNNARTNKFVVRLSAHGEVRATHKHSHQSEFGNSNPKFIYGFQVASYDKRYPLIIDPALVYSTYLGGSSADSGYAIAVDASGNAYVTGSTYSTDFPMVSAIYGSNTGSYSDTFITKLNASGNALVYSTYMGGSGGDTGDAIAVDASGNAYVTGSTGSTDFPTLNAIYGSKAGGLDSFITKINASGNSLVYSTYLGGSGYDYGTGVAVDTSGNAYVTGYTDSTNFPTISAIYESKAGGDDAFITKINASGSSLVYSTYLGGSLIDFGIDVAVDTSENAYVTGYTYSTNFPTASAIYESKAGGDDAFITKINASGSSLVYSTYLGGSSDDLGEGIIVDTSGNAYVTGSTGSTDFPTLNAIYGSNAGDFDAFITKLNASGNALVYSTYLGGSLTDYGIGVAVDTSENVYVTGYTDSTNFPTVSAIYESNAGIFILDAFITKLNASGSSLLYSTYLGGSSDDYGAEIALDTSGNAYVTGLTNSTDFPTLNAIDGSFAGGADAFVTKIVSDTIYGNIVDNKDEPIESAKIKLRGKKTKISRSTFSDESGFFQFADLHADTYIASAEKRGYKKTKQKVELEEAEAKEIELKMKKK